MLSLNMIDCADINISDFSMLTNRNKNYLANLPEDVRIFLASYLDANSMIALMHVNTSWLYSASHPELWQCLLNSLLSTRPTIYEELLLHSLLYPSTLPLPNNNWMEKYLTKGLGSEHPLLQYTYLNTSSIDEVMGEISNDLAKNQEYIQYILGMFYYSLGVIIFLTLLYTGEILDLFKYQAMLVSLAPLMHTIEPIIQALSFVIVISENTDISSIIHYEIMPQDFIKFFKNAIVLPLTENLSKIIKKEMLRSESANQQFFLRLIFIEPLSTLRLIDNLYLKFIGHTLAPLLNQINNSLHYEIYARRDFEYSEKKSPTLRLAKEVRRKQLQQNPEPTTWLATSFSLAKLGMFATKHAKECTLKQIKEVALNQADDMTKFLSLVFKPY